MAAPMYDLDPFAGRSVTVRPVRPDDLLAVGALLARLSPASRRLRFFSPIPRPRLSLVRPLVDADHIRREALVALCGDVVIGLAEYIRDAGDPSRAEIAVMVDDGYQRQGVARFLFRSLGSRAAEAGVEEFVATALPDNTAAIGLARAMSPGSRLVRNGAEIEMRIPLTRERRAVLASIASGGAGA